MKRTKRYGGFLVGDRVKVKNDNLTLEGEVVSLENGKCIIEIADVVGHVLRLSIYPQELINLTRQEEEKQVQQIEEYVYDPNKKVSLGEELAKADQTRRNLIKALNECDFDTANKIAKDNHLNCIFSPKSYDSDNSQKNLSKETEQPSVGTTPKTEEVPATNEQPKEPEVIEFEKPLSEESKRLKEIAENMQDRINLEKGNEVLVKAKQKAKYEQLAEDLAFLKDYGCKEICANSENIFIGLYAPQAQTGIYVQKVTTTSYMVFQYELEVYNLYDTEYYSSTDNIAWTVSCLSKDELVRFLIAYKEYGWEKAMNYK